MYHKEDWIKAKDALNLYSNVKYYEPISDLNGISDIYSFKLIKKNVNRIKSAILVKKKPEVETTGVGYYRP